MEPYPVPFSLITAFSSELTGGNPAAVVFHDTSCSAQELGSLAKTLKQPILSVVSPSALPSDDPEVHVRGIRFFAPKDDIEPTTCGHGTLAASSAVFSLPEVAASGVDKILFKNEGFGMSFTATKFSDGFIEISLPAPEQGAVDSEKIATIQDHVNRAFGKEIKIKDVKTGGTLWPYYCMIVLDETEVLAGASIDATALIGTGFIVHILTVKSPDPDYVFYSRMFAPVALIDEDAACGSAHGLLGPYWHRELGIQVGTEVKAKQVSERGAHIKLVWEPANEIVRLRGQTAVLASGTILAGYPLAKR